MLTPLFEDACHILFYGLREEHRLVVLTAQRSTNCRSSRCESPKFHTNDLKCCEVLPRENRRIRGHIKFAGPTERRTSTSWLWHALSGRNPIRWELRWMLRQVGFAGWNGRRTIERPCCNWYKRTVGLQDSDASRRASSGFVQEEFSS